jgi:hypothetical protein
MQLSVNAQKVYELLKKEYIERGYAYSGSLSFEYIAKYALDVNDFKDREIVLNALDELISNGIAQKRNCQAYAFELTGKERKKLILENKLDSKWQNDKTGSAFYPNSLNGEVVKVLANY